MTRVTAAEARALLEAATGPHGRAHHRRVLERYGPALAATVVELDAERDAAFLAGAKAGLEAAACAADGQYATWLADPEIRGATSRALETWANTGATIRALDPAALAAARSGK